MGCQSNTRIDTQSSSIDIACRWAAKKHNIISYLFGNGRTTERSSRCDNLLSLGARPKPARSIAVSVKAGQTEFTRMLCLMQSIAADLVMPTTACFEAT